MGDPSENQTSPAVNIPPKTFNPGGLGWRCGLAIVVLGLSGVLLFTRLGHTPLWSDEAGTALHARAVWETGDTGAMIGHNLVAFEHGSLLRNLKERFIPPLASYLAAPFVGSTSTGSFWPRFPFALCGWLSVAIVMRWLFRDRPPWHVWVLTALGVLGNVSLFLFCRQCRYYGPAILFTVVLGYLYAHRETRGRYALLIGLAASGLLATQYLNYAATGFVMVLDYALWGRKESGGTGGTGGAGKLTWRQWLAILLPQAITGAVVCSIWNPLNEAPGERPVVHAADRLYLLWMFLRDMNACEFMVGGLVLTAPLVWLWRRDRWLGRALVALLAYVVFVAGLTQQHVGPGHVAAVRYVAAAIPLCIALGVLTLAALPEKWRLAAVLVGCIAFASNMLHGGPWLLNGTRSTALAYARELIAPPPEPLGPTCRWINANVTTGQSIWALPDFGPYPLMYGAPRAVYAWQLTWPPQAQFAALPAIHFYGLQEPDYIILFGPGVNRPPADARALLAHYRLVQTIAVLGAQINRPEMFWHAFVALPCDVAHGEGVYIYRRSGA